MSLWSESLSTAPASNLTETPWTGLDWFRRFAPYISAHRGRTFVVYLGGEAVSHPAFQPFLHDLARLSALGIRLVLVHGLRPQIEAALALRGAIARYHEGLRITDAVSLDCVKEAAGRIRVEIEAQLSMGLPHSPITGTRLRVLSGNFVSARPVGVRDGVDFGQTGDVRRIDAEGIRDALDRGALVLLSAVGYSPTGEIFNLRSEAVATETAIALGADKLILFGDAALRHPEDGRLIRQLTSEEASLRLGSLGPGAEALGRQLQAAIRATRAGVERCHCLEFGAEGALLLELFTRDGAGTLISRSPFETLRPAEVTDVPGILELLLPLEAAGILIPRSRERLESEIEEFAVLDRDGLIVGCGALHDFSEDGMGEVACLALHPEYRDEGRGSRLLDHLEAQAVSQGFHEVFALTTQTEHWFRERGYQPVLARQLPERRRAGLHPGRNSKVLLKRLER